MKENFQQVQKILLQERDKDVKKTFGFSQKKLTHQFLCDLYSLPGSGGSDERDSARRWLERSGHLFESYESLQQIDSVFSTFSVPTINEIEKMAGLILNRSSGRNR